MREIESIPCYACVCYEKCLKSKGEYEMKADYENNGVCGNYFPLVEVDDDYLEDELLDRYIELKRDDYRNEWLDYLNCSHAN